MKYNVEEIQEKLHIGQLEGIGERLEEDIAGVLNRAGMYFRIFSRAKTPFSIASKLEKDGYGFGPGEKKLQDLVGLRVVMYYNDDMDIVRTVLEKTFRRVGEWSETDNSEEEFKASKLNGVFHIPEEYQRVYNGDISGIPAEMTFEVQLRTVSFEGWHEIEHDMRYKSPHGEKFWKNNEDLSRAFNCVLANLELCDWSTVSIFDKLSYYHFRQGNWEMMLKSKLRLHFDVKPLADELVKFLNDNSDVAYHLYRCDRDKVIYALLGEGHHERITYDLVIKVTNDAEVTYDGKTKRRLIKLCNEVLKRERTTRVEHGDLRPLVMTPAFQLNVVLTHNSDSDVQQEFLAAVQIIGNWAQGRLHNVAADIPTTPVDYEFHTPGYDVKILGNVFLGIYKLALDYIDTSRKGVVWRVNASLERSERIRMKVSCEYFHPQDRLVRDSFMKPRFVDEIFRKIGYKDVIPMSLKPGRIRTMEDMEALSAFIANSSRNLPVILAVEEADEARQINVARLAETVGTYAHVFLMDKKAVPILVEMSDYTSEELMGAVWVTFRGGEDKFFTREMIADSRFDLNRYAFDKGNVYEKAFRHKLVRLIKEKNC